MCSKRLVPLTMEKSEQSLIGHRDCSACQKISVTKAEVFQHLCVLAVAWSLTPTLSIANIPDKVGKLSKETDARAIVLYLFYI